MEQNRRNSNSNQITREYLDSLLIETRYIDAAFPDTGFELFGRRFSTPLMTAALSHLDHFMFEGAMNLFVEGAKKAGAVCWIGMSEEDEMDRLSSAGVPSSFIEIIKPYKDRDLIFKKLERAKERGFLAVGVDIDHPFSASGTADVVDDYEMAPMQTKELEQICRASELPVIIKGVLSVQDADRSLAAGAKGLMLSHHNNRIGYAVPPLMMLPKIRDFVNGRAELFVDCEISTGLDAFKALCLGAKGVCIGRPLMTAIKENGSDGVCEYFQHAKEELAKAMAYTGCADLSKMDASIIHRRDF